MYNKIKFKDTINLNLTQHSGQTSQSPWKQESDSFTDMIYLDKDLILKEDISSTINLNKLPVLLKLHQTENDIHGFDVMYDFPKKLNFNDILSNQEIKSIEKNIISKIRHIFDLDFNLDNFYNFLSYDDELYSSLEFTEGLRLFLAKDPFESLISSILSSNNSFNRWSKSINQIRSNWGEKIEFDNNILYTFPKASILSNAYESPEEEYDADYNKQVDYNKTADDNKQSDDNKHDLDNYTHNLKSCGVGYRAPYIKNACQFILDGNDINNLSSMDYSTAYNTILNISGVGPKVADSFLLYCFNFKEAFPSSSWIKQVISYFYFNNENISENKAKDFAINHFDIYKSYAQLYLFQLRNNKDFKNKLKETKQSSNVIKQYSKVNDGNKSSNVNKINKISQSNENILNRLKNNYKNSKNDSSNYDDLDLKSQDLSKFSRFNKSLNNYDSLNNLDNSAISIDSGDSSYYDASNDDNNLKNSYVVDESDFDENSIGNKLDFQNNEIYDDWGDWKDFDKILEGNDSVYDIEANSLSEDTINRLKKEYPHISEDIIENFTFEHPREGQLEIIAEIDEAISKGYKYIVLEAGTGTGKSVVASTLARMYGSAYILTMTKQLQEQYHNEFNFPYVKGRGNFDCMEEGLLFSCEVGACRTAPKNSKFSCPYGISSNPSLDGTTAFFTAYGKQFFFKRPEHCYYWDQKASGINSPITLMNYDYAILDWQNKDHFGKRELLILDEAHNIEDKLMKTMEIDIYNNQLKKDVDSNISSYTLASEDPKDWIAEISSIKKSYDNIDISEISDKNERVRINYISSDLKELKNNLKDEGDNWVIDVNGDVISFKPLEVSSYAKNALLKYGEVVIFLSATIPSTKMFSKWLGLEEEEVYHIKADSHFDIRKRPIIFDFAGKMSKNNIKRSSQNSIPILKKILKRHKNDKGIIHTFNYRCQEYIMNNLNNSRLIDHTSKNREKVLKDFEDDENPLVLVSPSMNEGVDLPYDKCRFQVIYKMPFPYLGDKQVFKRQQKEARWYSYKTSMKLTQTYGRGMRAEDDSCITYILDSDIKILLRAKYELVPNFFTEAIVKKQDIPKVYKDFGL